MSTKQTNNELKCSLKNDIVFKIFFGKRENQKFLKSFLESLLEIKINKLEVIQEASLDLLYTTDKKRKIRY